MAGTCDAQRPLPEMAGYASQMPKWSDGFLHSTGLLVEKDMHFQPLFRSIGFNFALTFQELNSLKSQVLLQCFA